MVMADILRVSDPAALESEWIRNYLEGKTLTPEEQIITEEEKKFMKLLVNIYDKDGVDGLTDYFFENLKFKKYEQVDSVLVFFRIRVSPCIERRLIREAQIMNKHQVENYAMRLGKIIFGTHQFIIKVRAK